MARAAVMAAATMVEVSVIFMMLVSVFDEGGKAPLM
jgi:hypothetical protein